MATRRLAPAVLLALWLAHAWPLAADLLALDDGWRCGTDPSRPEAYEPVELPRASDGAAPLHFRLAAPVPAAWAGFAVQLRVMASGLVEAALNGQPLGRRLATPLGAAFEVTDAVRPGRANTVELSISAPDGAGPPELRACRLEGRGPVAARPAEPSTLITAGGALMEFTAEVINRSGARFDGRFWMRLRRAGEERPMWERRRDFRVEPEQPARFAETAQLLDPVLWRHDSPFLYTLTTTVTTREDKMVNESRRAIGLRSVEAVGARWLVAGEWSRVAAMARHVPGAWLFSTRLSSAPLGEPEKLARLGLPDILGRCDAAGSFVIAEVPAPVGLGPEVLGAMVHDLVAQAAWHPSIWGWMVEGEAAAQVARLLRRAEPSLPVGAPYRAGAEEQGDFDFVVLRLQTSAVRRDDDDFGRKLDDCRRRIPAAAIVVLDQMQPANPGDFASIARSVANRCGQANRRPECAIVGFSFEANAELLKKVQPTLCPFVLNRPGHQVRRERDKIVLKSWFDVAVRSPVAGWMPCYSLRGARVRWRAEANGSAVASGSVELPTCRPSPLEGRARGRAHGEARWVLPGPGVVEFVAELRDAAGRALGGRRQRLRIGLKPDGKPELRIEQLE